MLIFARILSRGMRDCDGVARLHEKGACGRLGMKG